MPWRTQAVDEATIVSAPDGSEVRILCASGRGSMATFTPIPGAVSHAVAHRTVEEIWYVRDGNGRLWRRCGERDEVVALVPGLSLTIPPGTSFQFRCDGPVPLVIVGVTMPPWPGAAEALFVDGIWDQAR
jgi:mannose-6-phosphate isomerase-like protein (cupin superfamily)